MTDEEKKDSIKISVPLYTNQELEEMDRIILDKYETIMDKISKQVYKEKEFIVLQKVIKKQQVEIEEYKKANNYLQKRLNEKPEKPQYERMERLKVQQQNIQQNLIIQEMAQEISWKEPLRYNNKFEVIEYFTNKVKGEQNDKI